MNEKKMSQETPEMSTEKMEQIPPEMLEYITGGEGEYRYVCKICGRGFMTITSIACHMNSHK